MPKVTFDTITPIQFMTRICVLTGCKVIFSKTVCRRDTIVYTCSSHRRWIYTSLSSLVMCPVFIAITFRKRDGRALGFQMTSYFVRKKNNFRFSFGVAILLLTQEVRRMKMRQAAYALRRLYGCQTDNGITSEQGCQ